ncbi:MAG: glycosyltransferase family 2 protein [Solirubrobacteraceae bacterium]
MTLIVHNEVGLLDTHLRFHYAHGVDHVLAIDDRSTDGSSEVLQAHARTGRLTVIERPPGEMFASQSRWATSLARQAKTLCGADWVLNGDADEFWWPLHGSLTDALGRVGPEYGRVLIPRSDFVLVDEEPRSATVAEELVVREVRSPVGLRVAHRGAADIAVSTGHHRVARNAALDRLEWTENGKKAKSMEIAPSFPIRVFHYPVQSWASMVDTAREGTPYALNRDPVLRIMRRTVHYEDLRTMVLASEPRPPQARQRLIEDLIREGEFVRDTRIQGFIASGTPEAAKNAAEEREVAGLVMYALAHEDRKIRTRARRYQQQLSDRRASRVPRLKEGLTRVRAGLTAARGSS